MSLRDRPLRRQRAATRPAVLALYAALAGTAAPAQEAATGGGWVAYSGGWSPLEGATAGVTWTETEAGVRADLPSDVLFDFDSETLRTEASETLAALARGIAERDPARVRVEGHTDAKGPDAYNLDLSERRARAVLFYLTGPGGLSPERLTAEGFGESRPVAPNADPAGDDDPEGRQRNRRVEVVLEDG